MHPGSYKFTHTPFTMLRIDCACRKKTETSFSWSKIQILEIVKETAEIDGKPGKAPKTCFFATLKRTFWRCLNFLYLKSTCLMGIRFVFHLSCPISERNAPVSNLRHGPNREVIVHISSLLLVIREMKKFLRFLNFLSEHIFCYWRCCARIFQGIDHLENMLMFSNRV